MSSGVAQLRFPMISSNILASFITSCLQAPDHERCNLGAKQSAVAKLPVSLIHAGLHRPLAASRLPEYRHCRHMRRSQRRSTSEPTWRQVSAVMRSHSGGLACEVIVAVHKLTKSMAFVLLTSTVVFVPEE